MRAARSVLAGEGSGALALLPFLGPAFIASIAYVDPGNFATDIQGGARYGYLLLWVVLASNLSAMLVQGLAAKLGIATHQNLAEVCRERFPVPVVWALWVIAEVAAMATDLAEVIGAAIGINLLFGLPLLLGALITALATFGLLGLQRYGFRPLEAVVALLLAVVAASYVIETLLGSPDWHQVALHAVVPRLEGGGSVVLAVGILGATIMPHVVFLHSHLTQNRIEAPTPVQAQRLVRFAYVDVGVAMTIAGLVNAAMLIMAASTFHTSGYTTVASVQDAYKTLAPLLGRGASTVFGIALLASGLSSSTVGTMAGQVIMQGFLRRSIPLWLRRFLTMLPALVIIAIGLDPTQTLILSQVVLSFCLPFALVPLVLFTRRIDVMGALANRRPTTLVAWGVVGAIVLLNAALLYFTMSGA